VAVFEICYPFILGNEAGDPPNYAAVHDPTKSDPSAQAIAGVNSHYWPAWFAKIAAAPMLERPVLVAQFYRTNYWSHWLASLNSSRIAAMVLDASVNQGAGWGCKLLQRACGAEDDGLWGAQTLAAANAADLDDMVRQFVVAREARYREIGGPSLPQWLARAAKIPAFD
jgi:lysozyme family protein